MSDKPLTGVLYKTPHERSSYEIYEADLGFLFKIVNVLEARFGFAAVTLPVDGIDCLYWDFARAEIRLTVGWDIWSGCFVFADSEAGDEVVEEIGQYLDQVLHEL